MDEPLLTCTTRGWVGRVTDVVVPSLVVVVVVVPGMCGDTTVDEPAGVVVVVVVPSDEVSVVEQPARPISPHSATTPIRFHSRFIVIPFSGEHPLCEHSLSGVRAYS